MRNFPWVFSILWLAILMVMISAGFWQLSRADEKKLINERIAAGQVNQPQTLDQWQSLNAFDVVQVQGQYHNTHLLLDNQIMNGQVGYFVFTAFQTLDGIWMLVNRGWTDNAKEDVLVGNINQHISTFLADWPRPGVQLGEQNVVNKDIQHVTYMEQEPVIELLKERHCQQNSAQDCIILPRVLKLRSSVSNGMISGFVRDWQLPRMTVEKHRAYAAQWFTMSLVLCFIYVIFIKKNYASKN